MRGLREWMVRLWGTLRRQRADGDLEEELRFHLELMVENARRHGRPGAEAKRSVRSRAGDVSHAMDALRDQRGLPWLDAAAADLARTPRLVARHRGYYAFATMTLAVAVGVNLVVFTVVNALWLRPLPIPEADRVVTFANTPWIGLGGLDADVLRPFEAVAGQVMTDDESRSSAFQPEIRFDRIGGTIEVLGVTPEYFGLLGLIVRGRDFRLDDDRAGAEPVAIISDRLWTRAFGRREAIIGTVAAARPFPIRIVGVAPPDFEGARRGERADVWIPTRLVPRTAPAAVASGQTGFMLMAFARLHPGQRPADAERWIREAIEWPEGSPKVQVVPLKNAFGSPYSRTFVISERNALGVVAGLALLVLLGGCATLMAMVLVHYERRRRELAVRIALGVTRRRLAAELSIELAVVAVAGTAGAILLAVLGLEAIPALSLPGGVDLGRLDLSMDWRVLSAAVALTLLTLAVAAVLPVNRSTCAGVAGELLAGPMATASPSSQRVRQTLLALHVSATIVVLVAAGLFVRAVVYGFGDGPGFDAGRTLFVAVQLRTQAPREITPEIRESLTAALAERSARLRSAIRALPGVSEVAEGLSPVGPDVPDTFQARRAVETAHQTLELAVGTMPGSPELLRALGLPLLSGRDLNMADAAARPLPAVVTASLARTLWPSGEALGQVVSVGSGGRGGGPFQVVGVTRDFVYGSFNRRLAGVVVSATDRRGGARPQFVVRASSAEALVEPVRKVVRDLEPDARWVRIETGRELVTRDLGRQRLGAWFFSGFGLTALLLGVGGIFGLVAYLAESRQREFGVRAALGATPRDLIRGGLSAALVPVVIGIVAGLVTAALVARVFTSLLAGLSALDPLTYAVVAAAMLISAVLAGLGAAWRLRCTTPADALRAN